MTLTKVYAKITCPSASSRADHWEDEDDPAQRVRRRQGSESRLHHRGRPRGHSRRPRGGHLQLRRRQAARGDQGAHRRAVDPRRQHELGLDDRPPRVRGGADHRVQRRFGDILPLRLRLS